MSLSDTISRRSLLKTSAGATLPLLAGCSAATGWRDLSSDPARDAQWLWNRQLWMNDLGPRMTGSPAHLEFVQFIADELEAMGLPVQEDIQRFPRWHADRSAIAPMDDRSDPIEVASEYPYSASTGPDGIVAPLMYGGTVGDDLPDADLQGSILYLDAPVPPLRFGQYYTDVKPYGALQEFPEEVTQASGQIVYAPGLEEYARRGAKAVIFGWTNVSEEQARGQYIPFNRPPQPIPGLWVGPGASSRLRGLANSRGDIRLTLDATLSPDARSRTVYALVPGASDRIVIVTTHTDGPNAIEENGPLPMLAMARDLLSRTPAPGQPAVLFLFASGHFVGPAADATDRFLELHPDFRDRTVAGLAVEHLGGMEWQDDGAGRYASTGKAEMSLLFTEGEHMADIAFGAAQASDDPRGAVVRANDLGYFFGEGRALARAGIPTIGFLPAPSYLLATGARGHIEKLDRRIFDVQVSLCRDLLHRLLLYASARS